MYEISTFLALLQRNIIEEHEKLKRRNRATIDVIDAAGGKPRVKRRGLRQEGVRLRTGSDVAPRDGGKTNLTVQRSGLTWAGGLVRERRY